MTTNTTFFGGLKVASVQWSLSRATKDTRTRGGSVIRAEQGAALWTGSATLVPGYHAGQGEIEALLAELTAAGQFILAYDPRYNGPRMDPGGVILGNATPTIHTLDADNRRMRVTGLPAGYVLSVGDYLGFTYGSNPTRYALHRITSAATASGAGLTPLFSVTPHIRPGAAVAGAVTLLRPACKCLITAEYGAGAPRITSGATIGLIQTLR